jgi:hypothetical protein
MDVGLGVGVDVGLDVGTAHVFVTELIEFSVLQQVPVKTISLLSVRLSTRTSRLKLSEHMAAQLAAIVPAAVVGLTHPSKSSNVSPLGPSYVEVKGPLGYPLDHVMEYVHVGLGVGLGVGSGMLEM